MPIPTRYDVQRLVRRVLWVTYDTLSRFGMLYTAVDLTAATTRPHRLTGPGEGHPERVPVDVPLTPLERALLRELLRTTG